MTVGCWMVGLDERTSGWTDGWMTDGRMTDGWTDGRMDGWTDGRMDGCTLDVGSICLLSCHQPIHPFHPFIPSIDQRSKVKGQRSFFFSLFFLHGGVVALLSAVRHSSFVIRRSSLFLCRCSFVVVARCYLRSSFVAPPSFVARGQFVVARGCSTFSRPRHTSFRFGLPFVVVAVLCQRCSPLFVFRFSSPFVRSLLFLLRLLRLDCAYSRRLSRF